MKTQKAYLVYIHRYGFRAGEAAEILGVVIATASPNKPCAAYRVRFTDGHEEYVAVDDSTNFKIISEDDFKAGKIPAVIK